MFQVRELLEKVIIEKNEFEVQIVRIIVRLSYKLAFPNFRF